MLLAIATLNDKGFVAYYDFIPYKYGAYSFQLAQDVDVLRKNGYLTDENLLAEPEAYSSTVVIDSTAVESRRGDDLIRNAYQQFPYFAINSEIADRVLNKTEQTKILSIKEMLSSDEQRLLSIGYEGRSIEDFANTLLVNGIRVLCDVRINPRSRKFGFSQGILRHILESVGVDYVHIPELGIESEKRQALNSLDDYNALFTRYKKTLPDRADALKRVRFLLESKVRIALMCYERDPRYCHRTIIKEYLCENSDIKNEDL
jgi:uncharacterized protein (DUF488 family)